MASFFRRSKKEQGVVPTAPEQQAPSSVSTETTQPTSQIETAQQIDRVADATKQEQAQPEQQFAQPSTLEAQQRPEVQGPGVRASSGAQKQQPVAPLQPQPKTPERQEIEKLLAEGLTALYQTMNPEEQMRFRQKGAETATAIETMMTTFKATARKVLDLIRDWLSTIPRVNEFFLEQESKLKTDNIIKLQRKLEQEARIKNIGKDF